MCYIYTYIQIFIHAYIYNIYIYIFSYVFRLILVYYIVHSIVQHVYTNMCVYIYICVCVCVGGGGPDTKYPLYVEPFKTNPCQRAGAAFSCPEGSMYPNSIYFGTKVPI